MIKARITQESKILFVFDKAQSKTWLQQERVSSDGIMPFLKTMKEQGLDVSELSFLNLADTVDKPKAADYKAKAEYVKEVLDTYAFNVVVPIGAEATEKVLGFKGASKYFGKAMLSETYKDQKVIPCPNPAAALYNPAVTDQVNVALAEVLANKDFSEVKEADKRKQTYLVIDTLDKFKEFMTEFMKEDVKAFAYDTETTGFRFNVDELLTIQFSHKETYSYLLPCPFYNIWKHDEWAYITAELQRLFSDESKTVIGHNLKFDNLFLYHHLNIPVRKRNIFDTMIAHFLIDETTPHGLKELACQFTDLGDYEFELDKWKKMYCKANKVKVGDFSYKYIPIDILSYYALCDSDVTLRLYNIFKDKLVEEEQERVMDMVMRFQYLLSRMEINGSPVDVDYAKEYLVKIDAQIADLLKELQNVPFVKDAEAINNFDKKKPEPFNFNSVNQKRVLFYDVLKCRFAYFSKVKQDLKTMSYQKQQSLAKKCYKQALGKDWPTKEITISDMDKCFRMKGAVDKRSLKVWYEETDRQEVKDFIDTIRRYSELVKIRNTYVFSVLEKTVDGRIHPKFNVIGARSGRLSSSDPNYQNIPAHSDEAKKVKRITKAPEGWVLSGTDLSAAEMRYTVVASGDEKMAEVFNSGLDSHGSVAKDIFNLPCEINEVKKLYDKERQIAKSCAFLSIYGGQASALAATAGITETRAEEILSNYFNTYIGIGDFLEKTKDYIRIHGYSKSMLGRKNRHPNVPILNGKIGQDLTQEELQEMEKGIRVGVNATIQSVSSDGMLFAVCGIQDEIDELQLPMQIINVIHDAVYVLIREDFVQEGQAIIIKHLTKWPEGLICPFTGKEIIPQIEMCAEGEIGYSWDSLSEDFGLKDGLVEDEDDEEEED